MEVASAWSRAAQFARAAPHRTAISYTVDMTGQESATRRYEVIKHAVGHGREVHWKPESGMHPILRRWVRDAGDGNGVAMGKLGKCFADGLLGVEEDQEMAVAYWQMGADVGDAECQANLGSRLSRGYGVSLDEEEGFRYYMLSAKQGHYTGLYGAAVCYMNGEGVARDLDEAWRVINLALGSANACAGKDGGAAEDFLPDIERILAKINYMRGGGHAAVVFGPRGVMMTGSITGGTA